MIIMYCSIDIYSFGILAWEVLAEDKAFKEISGVALLGTRLHQGLRPPLSLIEAYPMVIKNMIISCWDKERANRKSAIECWSLLSKQFKNLSIIKHGVFLSYHSRNEGIAKLVFNRLISRGLKVRAACVEDCKSTLSDDIKQSSILVIILSPDYQSDENCIKILQSNSNKRNGRLWTIFTQTDVESWLKPKTIYFCQLFDSNNPSRQLPPRVDNWTAMDLHDMTETESHHLFSVIDDNITRSLVRATNALA